MTKDNDFDERLLVERVIAGELGAAEEFIDRYGPVVARVLRGFRISQEDRDDCWQILFVKLWDNDYALLRAWLRAWRSGSCLSSFIAVMANNVARDLLRSGTFVWKGRKLQRLVPLEPGFDPPDDDDPGGGSTDLPPVAIIRQIAKECLTPRHFEIFERYCRGENAGDIANAMNMTRNAVFVERFRMIRALRECLKKRGQWPV